ncbi:MAG: ATP-dependent zinc metalloprotease FtsH [Sedimentisphaerales bacterium]|nr:ATP-dependent zinc metalloprotease FtsH [Sedimentisphaerales bacterium]MBN2843323.1 ATP-dependent zinc metalloprotease FtsH [Sedimentisphaerales bacterium]
MAQDNNKKDNKDNKEPNRGNDKKKPIGFLNIKPGGGANFFILLVMLVLLSSSIFEGFSDQGVEITYDELIARIENSEKPVLSLTCTENVIKGQLKDDAMVGRDPKEKSFYVTVPGEVIDTVSEKAVDNNVSLKFEKPSLWNTLLLSILPWLLIFAFMYFFFFRQMKGGGGILGNFGRSRHTVHNREQSKVTFKDVAGIDEAKDEVQEIIQFLRNPRKFQRLGGRIPRGVLLIGEPGCGKTLMAKAIAGEADVPFFSISGSDFVEMFVGVGASRVRDLFKQAKDNSPCIIFLDEIDAVGRKRGSGIAGGGNDEREQTLNAILVEMDGFSTNDQVIVMAATNRADVLDNALTRPGRFDRQVFVSLPDVKGRKGILEVHARKIKMAGDVDLERLAKATPMFSGADLEAIINEAAIQATLSEKDAVEMVDLEEARDKVRWGRADRSKMVDHKERKNTAYHEAGHALVQAMLKNTDPIHKVSVIPRGRMGGATFSLPEKDRHYYNKSFCLDYIKVCLAGQVAESIFCGDITSGVKGDIMQATGMAKAMVTEWGMSEKLGFVHYNLPGQTGPFGDMTFSRDHSEKTAQDIDAEIRSIIDSAYVEVRQILESNREIVENLCQALEKYETIDGDEVQMIINGQKIDRPTVADLLAVEQNKFIASQAQTQTDNGKTAINDDRSADDEQL